MSGSAWVLIGLAAWLVLSFPAALVVGRLLRRRSAAYPLPTSPTSSYKHR